MDPRQRGADDPKAETDATRTDEIRTLPFSPATHTHADRERYRHTPVGMAMPNEKRNDGDVDRSHPVFVTSKSMDPFDVDTWAVDYERQRVKSKDSSGRDSGDLSITAEK